MQDSLTAGGEPLPRGSRTLWASKKVSAHELSMIFLLSQAYPVAHWLCFAFRVFRSLAFLPSKLFPRRRNDEHLLVPLDYSEAESPPCTAEIWFDHKQAFDLLKFESSPLERLPAMVVDKSKRPYAGGDLMSGGVILLACIETRDGDTQYYHIGLKLFREIERGDMGVAYTRGEHMLDFKKIALKGA